MVTFRNYTDELLAKIRSVPYELVFGVEIRPTRRPFPQLGELYSDILFSQPDPRILFENVPYAYEYAYGLSSNVSLAFAEAREIEVKNAITADQFGRSTLLAAQFGSGGYIELKAGGVFTSGGLGAGNGQWSFAIEFRPDALDNYTLYSVADPGASLEDYLKIGMTGGGDVKITIEDFPLSDSATTASAFKIQAGVWHTLVVTAINDGSGGTDVTCYLNGVDLGTINLAAQVPFGLPTDTNFSTIIGAEADGASSFSEHFIGRIGRLISWRTQLSGSEVDDIMLTINDPYKFITGDQNIAGYFPSVENISAIGATIDPITHIREKARLTIAINDDVPFGNLRTAIKNYPAESFQVCVKVGHPDVDPDNWGVLYTGFVEDYTNDGSIIELDTSPKSTLSRANVVSGGFIGHPFDICRQLITAAGHSMGQVNYDSFDPLDAAYSEISHFNVGRFRDPNAVGSTRTNYFSQEFPIYQQPMLQNEPVAEHLDELAALCDSTIIEDSLGRLAVKYHNPDEAPVKKLERDDLVNPIVESMLGNLFNRVSFERFAGFGRGEHEISGLSKISFDNVAAQAIGTFGPNGPAQKASLDLTLGRNWLQSGMNKSLPSTPYDISGGGPWNNVGGFNSGWLGVCGHTLGLGQRIQSGTQNSGFALNPAEDRYLYLMQLRYDGQSSAVANNPVPQMHWTATNIMKIDNVSAPDWSFTYRDISVFNPFISRLTSQNRYDIFPIKSYVDIIEQELFSTNVHSIDPDSILLNEVLLDITIPVFLMRRKLSRFQRGAPVIRTRLNFEHLDLYEGALVRLDWDVYNALGFDGTDTGDEATDPVFEITEFKVFPQNPKAGIEIQLTYLRTGTSLDIVDDDDIRISYDSGQPFWASDEVIESLPFIQTDASSFALTINSPSNLDFNLAGSNIQTLDGRKRQLKLESFGTLLTNKDYYLYFDLFTSTVVEAYVDNDDPAPTAEPQFVPLYKIVTNGTAITTTERLVPTKYFPDEVVDTNAIVDDAVTIDKIECAETSSGQTTNDTETTLLAIDLDDETQYTVRAYVTAAEDSGDDRNSFVLYAGARRGTGIAVLDNYYQDYKACDNALDAKFDVDGNSLRVRITGLAATTIDWRVDLFYTKIPAPFTGTPAACTPFSNPGGGGSSTPTEAELLETLLNRLSNVPDDVWGDALYYDNDGLVLKERETWWANAAKTQKLIEVTYRYNGAIVDRERWRVFNQTTGGETKAHMIEHTISGALITESVKKVQPSHFMEFPGGDTRASKTGISPTVDISQSTFLVKSRWDDNNVTRFHGYFGGAANDYVRWYNRSNDNLTVQIRDASTSYINNFPDATGVGYNKGDEIIYAIIIDGANNEIEFWLLDSGVWTNKLTTAGPSSIAAISEMHLGNNISGFFTSSNVHNIEFALFTTDLDSTELEEAVGADGIFTDLEIHSQEANLEAWWRFGDMAQDDPASIVKDQTGNHDLTIVGSGFTMEIDD